MFIFLLFLGTIVRTNEVTSKNCAIFENKDNMFGVTQVLKHHAILHEQSEHITGTHAHAPVYSTLSHEFVAMQAKMNIITTGSCHHPTHGQITAHTGARTQHETHAPEAETSISISNSTIIRAKLWQNSQTRFHILFLHNPSCISHAKSPHTPTHVHNLRHMPLKLKPASASATAS